jgi:hypothetical protein
VIRRFSKSSWAGDFKVDESKYKVAYNDDSKTKQVYPYAEIQIEFDPNQNVEAEKIAFVQAANTTR